MQVDGWFVGCVLICGVVGDLLICFSFLGLLVSSVVWLVVSTVTFGFCLFGLDFCDFLWFCCLGLFCFVWFWGLLAVWFVLFLFVVLRCCVLILCLVDGSFDFSFVLGVGVLGFDLFGFVGGLRFCYFVVLVVDRFGIGSFEVARCVIV